MTPKSDNILSQVAALYGNAIASGLIKQFPLLGEALKTFAAPENAVIPHWYHTWRRIRT